MKMEIKDYLHLDHEHIYVLLQLNTTPHPNGFIPLRHPMALDILQDVLLILIKLSLAYSHYIVNKCNYTLNYS